jgi:hypothetical protein
VAAVTNAENGRALFFGGLGVACAGLIALLEAARLVMPVGFAANLYVFVAAAGILAGLVLLGSFILLAVAFHGEVGIAGHSRLGRAVLIVFGASWLVYEIFATVVANAPGLEVASRLIGTSLTVLFGAAAFASAIFVVRAGVLHGFARWSLLLAALFDGALTLLSLVPDVTFVTFLLIWQTDLIVPLTLLIVGASYILAGRARGIALRMVTSR